MPEDQVQQAALLNGNAFGLSGRARGVNDIRQMLNASRRAGIIYRRLSQLPCLAIQANMRRAFYR